jgi:hypothetical protein
MYPAPAGTTPNFTRKQLGTEPHGLAFWNGVSGPPQIVLAMATGPFKGRNGKPALMWVLRYPGEVIPNYGPGCPGLRGAALKQCLEGQPPSGADLYAFIDATTGARYTSGAGYNAQQSLTFIWKPGWPAIDRWVAKYR